MTETEELKSHIRKLQAKLMQLLRLVPEQKTGYGKAIVEDCRAEILEVEA